MMTCKGWPANVSADTLNTLIPYGQVYFSAGAMVPGALKPTTFQTLPVNAQQSAIDVHKFVGSDDTECYFNWAFRGFPINISAPAFKLCPLFIQIDEEIAPNPAEYAYVEYSIGVSYEDTTIDYSMEGAAEVAAQSLIPDAWKNFMATTTGDKSIAIPDLFGDAALNQAKFNTLRFEIERFGNNVLDTFTANSIYLKGCLLQYATDFNNVAVFPT